MKKTNYLLLLSIVFLLLMAAFGKDGSVGSQMPTNQAGPVSHTAVAGHQVK
jgi:hypothetical protein